MALFKSTERKNLDAVLGGFWRIMLRGAQEHFEERCADVRRCMGVLRDVEGEAAVEAAIEAADREARVLPQQAYRLYCDLVHTLRDQSRLAGDGSAHTWTDASPAGPATVDLSQVEEVALDTEGTNALRQQCLEWLSTRFNGVYTNSQAAIIVPEIGPTAALIEVSGLPNGRLRINVHAPVAVGMTPTPQLMEYVARGERQLQPGEDGTFAFGALRVHQEPPDPEVMLEFEYSLFGELTTADILSEVVTLVGSTASILHEVVVSRFGGRSVYA